MKPDLGPEQELLIARLVNTGATVQDAVMILHHFRSHEVKAMYGRIKRPYSRLRKIINPEEIALRRQAVQERWDSRDWGRRWVGRFATTRETDLQQAASKMLS
ncbi:MAG: hypothetical protein EBS89_09545 [Proteobacteria bacterium]|nr:hypothetical protein [Pseudomonadota bacterium]